MDASRSLPPVGWSALVVVDDTHVRQAIRVGLEAGGARVFGVGTRAGALDAAERTSFDIVFLDVWLLRESGLDILLELRRKRLSADVVMVTSGTSYKLAMQAGKLGAVDYLVKPFTPTKLRNTAYAILDARHGRRSDASVGSVGSVGSVEVEFVAGDRGRNWIYPTRSPVFSKLLGHAQRVANAQCGLLLLGESGTGKNMLALWIHAHGPRATRPFVSINCPALSTELMSSELFGHRKGSFTGADADSIGKVQAAEGGTLFLDEVGDLSLEAQARLLRFLNDLVYERVGETKERQADVCILAATNRDLEADVRTGRFREDLFHRLNVITLTLPSLRERREDVLPLAEAYLREGMKARARPGLAYSRDAEQAMSAYRWPGNLRELHNAVARAVVAVEGSLIEPEHLGLTKGNGDTREHAVSLGAPVPLEAIVREHIARVVAQSDTIEAAARTLGIDERTLQRKRKALGLV